MRFAGMMKILIPLALVVCAEIAHADKLAQEVNSAFRKIGVGPEQIEPYTQLYEKFLLDRNMQVRRVMNNRMGEQLTVLARKRSARAARKSVKQMRVVLTDDQLKYYEEYLELANKLFIREAGLR